jgi:glycosyltransferase 2 family protein
VIRLISAGLLLAGAFAASAAAFRWLLGPAASVPGGLGTAGQVITGLVQVACLAAVVLVVAATLRRRRFRLLAGLAAGALAAAGLTAGMLALLGAERPATLTINQARGSWLASTAFPAPALLAAAVAVVVAAAPWLSRPWRRAAWLALLLAAAARLLAGAVLSAELILALAAAARLLTGAVLPAELILALAAGVTAGAAVLVTLGVPDRRIGPAGIAAALRDAGLRVESVRPAEVESKGSRPFAAVTADGRRLFVKALGSDQRDADLLYRAYRAVRLRNVGDTRPAASLLHAVEHQALVGLMAERAGFSAPGGDRVVRAGTAGQDQFGRGLDNEPERDAARDVERQMGPDVDTGQPDQGDDAQHDGAAGRAQAG